MKKDIPIKIGNIVLNLHIKTYAKKILEKILSYFKGFIELDGIPDFNLYIRSHYQIRKGNFDIKIEKFIKNKISEIHKKFPYCGFLQINHIRRDDVLKIFTPEYEYNLIRKFSNCRILNELCLKYMGKEDDLFFFITSRGLLIYEYPLRRGYLFPNILNTINGAFSEIITGIFITFSINSIQHNGCFLHGAGIVEDNNGYIFLALSGGGKTTLAELSQDYKILSDETIYLEKEGNKYIIHPTPFTQFPRRIPSLSHELNSIFLLQKSSEHSIEKINKSEALSKVILHHIHFFRFLRPIDAEKMFIFCYNILNIIPAYKLYFKKDRKFWEMIKTLKSEGLYAAV